MSYQINNKNKKISLILFFCLVVALAMVRVHLVRADESAAKTDLIWQKERLEAEITQARQDYNQSLEEYRNKERVYDIAYDQYASLKTLATLEDLVVKTKAVAVSRDQVLMNYFELLKLNLFASEGVELSVKNQYLNLIEDKIGLLKKHHERLQEKNSQSEVQESLEDFAEISDLEKISQQVLALLAISRLQRVYDLAIPLKKDIDSFRDLEELSALSALVRASEETDKTLGQAKSNLKLLWEKAEKTNSLETIYRNLTTELNPVYINLSQSLTYLGELLKL
ncbi:MAG: hypothetical protein GX559_01805 [Candidatus Pacebacteria bacterium]|mgnify:CR=1 FL=1|nr:hypothetical protein [Candidatus Paceibacterota bacterium]